MLFAKCHFQNITKCLQCVGCRWLQCRKLSRVNTKNHADCMYNMHQPSTYLYNITRLLGNRDPFERNGMQISFILVLRKIRILQLINIQVFIFQLSVYFFRNFGKIQLYNMTYSSKYFLPVNFNFSYVRFFFIKYILQMVN